MRKIKAIEYVTLDGVMQDPGGTGEFEYGGWTMPYWNDEIARVQVDASFSSDALLLGRVTYEAFAAAWPKMEGEEGADRMNGLPKYVVSTTLQTAEWNNSRIIKGDAAAEISRLKQQPGQDILIYGSSVLVNTLLQQDLLDEYQLLVYPVVLGSGKRLFNAGSNSGLKLLAAQGFSSGVTFLHYARDGK